MPDRIDGAPPLSARLWAASAAPVAAVLAHPFVRGLADGSLPAGVFAAYVLQDAVFLDACSQAYAAGAARSPDHDGREAFAGLLAGAREERARHERWAAARGLDLAAVEPTPATLAYTGFLHAAADVGELDVLCAATAPCARLYAVVGRTLSDGGAAGPHRAWVDAYADPAVERLAATLEELLDRYATDTPAVRAAYARALQLELDFLTGVLA